MDGDRTHQTKRRPPRTLQQRVGEKRQKRDKSVQVPPENIEHGLLEGLARPRESCEGPLASGALENALEQFVRSVGVAEDGGCHGLLVYSVWCVRSTILTLVGDRVDRCVGPARAEARQAGDRGCEVVLERAAAAKAGGG